MLGKGSLFQFYKIEKISLYFIFIYEEPKTPLSAIFILDIKKDFNSYCYESEEKLVEEKLVLDI